MKILIDHKNSTRDIYPQQLIENELKRYLREKASFDTLILSVWMVGKKRIHAINKKYRKKDEITDILSITGFIPEQKNIVNLGQIIFCNQVVKTQSIRYSKTYDDELRLYLRHSIDHLLDEYNKWRADAEIYNSMRS